MTKKPAIEDTAYHEAGHVIAHFVQGLTIDNVSIVAADDYFGICYSPPPMLYETTGARERRQVARASIVASYAGYEAEQMLNPNAPDYHGRDDYENAFELSREFGVLPRRCSFVGDEFHMAYLRRLQGEARSLVRKNWDKVQAIAQALIKNNSLSREEAESILSD